MMSVKTNVDKFKIIAMGKRIGRANSVIPRQIQWMIYRLTLLSVDIIMIGLAFRLAYFFRFEAPFSFFDPTAAIDPDYYRSLVLLAAVLWIVIFVGERPKWPVW